MLQAGPNKIRLDFQKKASQASLHGVNASRGVHTSYLTVINVPNTHVPPLHLVLLVARDSPGTYDALPGEIQREGNGIPTAIRKFRMAGLLWQAFTAEQMRRQGFGMRTFRFEEEWQPGTVAAYDDSFTNEVKIHVVRMKETVADIRNLDYAQQYDKGNDRNKLHEIATNACRDYFKPPPGCPQHIAAMFLDTHWDPSVGVIRGHAALGSSGGDIRVGIFGSHALHAYPSSLGTVLNAFNDFTPTDTKYVANDVGRSGSNWEACCIGLAAHLHEAGHALGLPHEESGIMAADYGRFNRTFCVWEGYRSATGERGQRILEEEQESAFHELSALRLSTHPCLRKPGERPLLEDSVQVFPVDDYVCVTATAGIAWIEYFDGKDEPCKYYENFLKRPSTTQLRLSKNIRAELPQFLQRAKTLRVKIYSKARGEVTIEDFDNLFADTTVKVGSKKIKAFRGLKVGFGQMEGSRPQEVIMHSFFDRKKVLNAITVYSGAAMDGLEFHYEDSTSQLFGKRGGKPGGSRFELNTRIGEQLHGFVLRAGLWIDGLQIVTTHSRTSPFYGNPRGGSL
jgi:Putative peptidase family